MSVPPMAMRPLVGSMRRASSMPSSCLPLWLWPMAASLWGGQGRIDDPHLWERCAELGLDVDRFEADRRSTAVADRVRRDVHEGLRAGVAATPTLFAGGDAAGRAGPPDAAFLAALAI
jgi:2-hydroxychromene-2-carboxylate isomerase